MSFTYFAGPKIFSRLRFLPLALSLFACQVSLGQRESPAPDPFARCESPNTGEKLVIPDSLLIPIQAGSAVLLGGEEGVDVWLLAYVNFDCSACIRYLSQWKQLVDTLQGCYSFGFRVIAEGKSSPSVGFRAKEADFDYPVFFDQGGSFYQQNQLWGDPACDVFLVDQEGKILISGNPLFSAELLADYQRHLPAVTGGCE